MYEWMVATGSFFNYQLTLVGMKMLQKKNIRILP
jgi:hypothetical protein